MESSSSPPARSSRFSSASRFFSRSKTKTPADKSSKPQDPDQAGQKTPMEQQGAKAKESGGVRFENVKVGKGCAYVSVSTIGKEVYGKDVEIDDHTSWYGGQMSDKSLQSLPKAQSLITEESSVRDQNTEDIGFNDRHGAGRTLEETASTGTGARRRTWSVTTQKHF
ncbi:hypothetical protein B7463_g3433, partial [Scytalidium lignicola]